MRAVLSPELSRPDFALAVHGGVAAAGRDRIDGEWAEACRQALALALSEGRKILAAGGAALDAVTAAVCVLEDDPHFDAGRGSAFTSAGGLEMDAAVMDGRDRRAGAVAAIFGPKNPVLAARAVMEASPHVLLVGEGALAFCREQGLEFCEADYFRTERAWNALQRRLERREVPATDKEGRHGTVGAVARDGRGDLAAATSTGGITGKAPGRVGDSPIIGAGTYADNESCAVSATGLGEVFLRAGAAFEVAARLKHAGQSLADAAAAALDAVAAMGGAGGVIAVDNKGALAMPFRDCAGIYRGYVRSDGEIHTAIWDEDRVEG
jgi:L-asparaginase / beta-aspartyl-peptidase